MAAEPAASPLIQSVQRLEAKIKEHGAKRAPAVPAWPLGQAQESAFAKRAQEPAPRRTEAEREPERLACLSPGDCGRCTIGSFRRR